MHDYNDSGTQYIKTFDLLVDFQKAGNGIYDITGCSKSEEDYVESIKCDDYRVSKYKKILFVTYFEGYIDPIAN